PPLAGTRFSLRRRALRSGRSVSDTKRGAPSLVDWGRYESDMAKYQDGAPAIATSPGQLFDTLRILVGREFRVRYQGSGLGIIWAIITPLGTVVVLHYVFAKVLTFAAPHFGAFMYSAMLPWVWFQSAVQLAATTLRDNRALVRTPFFSKPLLPWTVTC